MDRFHPQNFKFDRTNPQEFVAYLSHIEKWMYHTEIATDAYRVELLSSGFRGDAVMWYDTEYGFSKKLEAVAFEDSENIIWEDPIIIQ